MKPPDKVFLSQDEADRISGRLERLYGPEPVPALMKRFSMMLGGYGVGLQDTTPTALLPAPSL